MIQRLKHTAISRVFAVLAAFLFSLGMAHSQNRSEDTFDFYLTLVDEKPASIFVNTSLWDNSPMASHPHLTYLRVGLRAPTEHGLAGQQDYEALLNLSETIEELSLDQAIFAGRKMGQGTNDYYFYTRTKGAIDGQIKQAMTSRTGYRYEIGHRDDPKWAIYREFLYPGPYHQRVIKNSYVRQALQEAGDNPDTSRPIDHFAVFQSQADADKFSAAVKTMGHTPKRLPMAEDQSHTVQIVIDGLPYDIDPLTYDLTQLAEQHSGVYDGWASPVMQ